MGQSPIIVKSVAHDFTMGQSPIIVKSCATVNGSPHLAVEETEDVRMPNR